MNDILLQLGSNPTARNVIGKLGLPLPIPTPLRRAAGPRVERELADLDVFVGVAGERSKIVEPLARILTTSGACVHVASEDLHERFAGLAEAWAVPVRVVDPNVGETPHRVDRLVFDATGIDSVDRLDALYTFFRPLIRGLRKCGRVVVLRRTVDQARNADQAAARAAVEGFTRSLAKEIGRRGSTANLVDVDQGAENLIESPLRFLLSDRSAFVSGQVLRVRALPKGTELDDASAWSQPLAGKVALVTGAARGIGAATCRTLAAEGATVVCLDRPEDDEALAKIATQVGGVPLPCDVTAEDACDLIGEFLSSHHGGVDIVVHNAGVTRDKTLGRMKREAWDLVMAVNLRAIVDITRRLIDDEVLREGARIVALSSVAGVAGNLGQTNYAATKSALVGWVAALAEELAPEGMSVNAIAPGFIETRLTARIPTMIREAGRRLSNLGQGGRPVDVAEAITFLSLPQTDGLRGDVLRVCGGALIGA